MIEASVSVDASSKGSGAERAVIIGAYTIFFAVYVIVACNCSRRRSQRRSLQQPNAAVDQSRPITVYRASHFEEGIECAVCLSKLADGEEARLLPQCGHGYHRRCIDPWLRINDTCPLCRSRVRARPSADPSAGAGSTQNPPAETVPESPVSERNSASAAVDDGAGSPGGEIVIEMMMRVVDGLPSPVSPETSNRSAMEETAPPSPARFWWTWILEIRGTAGASSEGPREGDIGLGLGGGGGVGGGEGNALPPNSPNGLSLGEHPDAGNR
ncbi:RING-H2 finger protein ATL64-like [Musa acuminata AAA Group]|uniref:RING-H2 finger protein ATL64-like n=1 Tax=Musa acuminata AAA Group TaxID=214697 RepID=UPI0031DB6BA7